MSRERQQVLQPSQPPDFKRKLDFYPFQLIGIPLLFLIPILALLGVLGETRAVVRGSGDSINVVVNYSNRINFLSLDETEISIRNTTNEVISTLTVTIEKAFLENFSEISFMSDIKEITEEAYIIELFELHPNESRSIIYESRGARIGSHRGTITISTGENTTSVTVETFIYP